MNTFLYYFLLFIIYSFIGWIIDITTALIEEPKLYNRGFLIGPYCPIYGFVAMMMIFALFLENMADTSYLSGKGMGYFMLLAMAIKGSYVSKKKVLVIKNDDENDDDDDKNFTH